jgi:predicted ATPase with chaperone activity
MKSSKYAKYSSGFIPIASLIPAKTPPFPEPSNLDDEGEKLIQSVMQRLNLSARAYTRVLKLSRTIADLEGVENIQPQHVAEAVGYRSLDRG